MPFMEFDLEMNKKSYVGHKVLVPRPVGIQAASVGKLKPEFLLAQMDTKRSPGAGYKRGDFQFDSFSYATEEYGEEEPLDDRQVAMYADILDAETIHSARAASFVLDHYERDCASTLYNTTTFTGALTAAVAAKWNDWVNATPIQDIVVNREKVIVNSGLVPNTLLINSYQFWNLVNTAQIVDRIKYTETATQTEVAGQLAAVLGVEQVIVAGALTNTAATPTAAAISRIWSNSYAMLCCAAKTEDPQEPCIGRTFMWTGDGPGAPGTDEQLALIMEEYREEKVRGSVFRGRNDREIVLMYAAAGLLLTGVIA
jgi:hypothetical protein